MSGVEFSGGQTVAMAPLTAVHQPVGAGTRGDRHFTLGTIVIGAVAVHSNLPVSIDETFVSAIRTVESRLSRRGIFGGLGGGQFVYIYRLQTDNPRASTLRDGSITETSRTVIRHYRPRDGPHEPSRTGGVGDDHRVGTFDGRQLPSRFYTVKGAVGSHGDRPGR